MAAPSSTVPCPTNAGVDVLTYVEEVVVGAAMLLQQAPVVGDVCATFLSFQQLVETAKSNTEDLEVLRDLCDVVIKGVLDKRSDRSGLLKGFAALEKHVKKAEEVSKLCNGAGIRDTIRRCLLARKISGDINGVRRNIVDVSTVNNLAVANDLNVELLSSKDGLAAMLKQIKEQRRIADLASKVKAPSGAPRIRDWYVQREAVVEQTCDRLGIGSNYEEPQMVGLVGPGGAGKSTVASMVVAREDVRASFHKGVLWLQVGKGAKDRLCEVMIRLADMVYQTVMRKTCRPPRKSGVGIGPEDGLAYIQEVVDNSSRRFLVVADDVWEVEVLDRLRGVQAWVLYTTRLDGVAQALPLFTARQELRLDQVLKEEAEVVLRQAADLDDNERLPEAAYDLMMRCENVVLDLALVGRWGVVRGRRDEKAWRVAFDRIVGAQREGESGQLLSWRAAVLRAGLQELACENPQNLELYLALAVIPNGLAFPSEIAAVLLFGDDLTTGDLEAAEEIAATLERWSILTLEDGGKYRIHDEHADFVRGRLSTNQGTRDVVLTRWREYVSSIEALLAFSGVWLVEIWNVLARFDGEDIPSRPYTAALGTMDPSNADLVTALQTAAEFHWLREDWLEAYNNSSQLLELKEGLLDGESLELASTVHNLGVCAFMAGRTGEAEEFHRRAYSIRAGKLDPKEFRCRVRLDWQENWGALADLARTQYSLGVCVFIAGLTKEGEELYRRALAFWIESQGAHAVEVARTLYSLGVFTYTAGRVEKAEEFLLRALNIGQIVKMASIHPDVVSCLESLRFCVDDARQTEIAEALVQRALDIQGELEQKRISVPSGVRRPAGHCTLGRGLFGLQRRLESP